MSLPANPEATQRLFLALWPEETTRQQIAALATQALGRQRRIADAQLHLTLVFLGATAAERLAAYQAALADLPVPEMTLLLDRYGCWSQTRILWLGSSQTPPELYELVAELHRRLRGCGLTPEARAFQAHVTLARRYSGPIPAAPPTAPVCWPVRDIALVESTLSRQTSHYQVLRRWPERRAERQC